jgi:hypothetical protein
MMYQGVGVPNGGTRRDRLMKTCAPLTDAYESLDWSVYFATSFDSAASPRFSTFVIRNDASTRLELAQVARRSR